MKHLKKFESFSNESTNESWFSGKNAYKRTVEFIEGDSEESKQIKDIYKEIKDSGKDEKDPDNLKRIKNISFIGKKWAEENKMDSKDYNYSSIRTVLEEDYARKYKGGPDFTVGESKKYPMRKRKI